MATPEHRALVEVLRVGLSDQDTITNANPPVVILRDMAQVCCSASAAIVDVSAILASMVPTQVMAAGMAAIQHGQPAICQQA